MWQNPMLTQLQHLFDSWFPWITGAAGITAVLSWLPGGGAIITVITSALRFVASFFEMISPIINALLSGIIWSWRNIFWPGLLDILDSWATIVTVLLAGFILWTYLTAESKIQTVKIDKQLNVCEKALTQCKAPSKSKSKKATYWGDQDTPFPWIFTKS